MTPLERLAELFPELQWEQVAPNLYRAEENDPPDADGLEPAPHWRYALAKGGQLATLMIVKELARTDLDQQGIVEMLEQYHAAGRVL